MPDTTAIIRKGPFLEVTQENGKSFWLKYKCGDASAFDEAARKYYPCSVHVVHVHGLKLNTWDWLVFNSREDVLSYLEHLGYDDYSVYDRSETVILKRGDRKDEA